MGDVIMFRSRASQPLDADVEAVVGKMKDAMQRERRRRELVYGGEETTHELERIIGLYPMFQLTHATVMRRCLFCEHPIAPMELHFATEGGYVCQSGLCMGDYR
jgi:hypothetical protein